MSDPRTMHCQEDPTQCRGESYCACQCDKCKAAHAAGEAFYKNQMEERYGHLKRDPRDTFVHVGGFHGGRNNRDLVTFRPWNAAQEAQGNGDPLPDYAVSSRGVAP